MFEGKFGRLFLNYSHAVALDQNRNQQVKATWEMGSGMIRPMMASGVVFYTEPSYCVMDCRRYVGSAFEAGVKVLLTRPRFNAFR